MTAIFPKGRTWLKRMGKSIVAAPAQKAVRIYLERKFIRRYGEFMDLHVDSERKTISATVLPKGELQSIEITAKYKMQNDNGRLSVTITSVKTSREWLTILADDYFIPHTFDDVSRIVKSIL